MGVAVRGFGWERHSGDLDVVHNAAATYSDILGAEGIAEYRRLAKAEWDALPPLGPGQDERSYSSRRFRITQIMQTLAELTGDVDAVADVLARDQSSPYQFVRIAELYTKAGRHGDALAWAEKGLALHGGSDSRLVEAAAEEYHRAGRGADAVRVAWDASDAAPALRTYRQLAEQATRAGLWPDWHDKAITLLRERVAKGQPKPSGGHVSRWAARELTAPRWSRCSCTTATSSTRGRRRVPPGADATSGSSWPGATREQVWCGRETRRSTACYDRLSEGVDDGIRESARAAEQQWGAAPPRRRGRAHPDHQ